MHPAARAAALLVVSTAVLLPSRARAEDPKPAPADSPFRLFHVDALVAGRPEFLGTRLGIVPPDAVNDEANPLFGAQGEEPVLPLGSVDELVELLKGEVERDSWEDVSGVGIRPLGPGAILVRQRPDALAAIGAAIQRWEDRWLRTVTVEVQAVRLPAGGPPAPGADLGALARSDAAGPGVSVTAMPGQLVTAYGGRQRPFVQDYDVEVAVKSRCADPIVGVANLGLSVEVRALPSTQGDRVTLDLEGSVAEWLSAPQVRAVEGGSIEVPTLHVSQLRVSTDVPAGAWTFVDGTGTLAGQPGWAFLVRARANARPPGAAATGDPLPVLDNAGMGKLERRTFDLSALQLVAGGRQAAEVNLVPSNFTPPEPPELAEPTEAVSADTIVELIRAQIAPEVWHKGALSTHRDALVARAPEAALAAIEQLLAGLKRSLLWWIEVDGEVLEVPAGLALGGEALLSEAAAKELAAARADGSAKVVDRVRVSSRRGTRNHVRAGRERAYLQDYEVEIAEDAFIGNPVVQQAFEGVVLDVETAVTSAGTGAAIVVRLTRTWLPETFPTFGTPWGEIHVPEMRTVRLRTMVDAPFGGTTVVGSTVEAGRRTVLLLTPHLRRAGD